jgi:hypothetical protein
MQVNLQKYSLLMMFFWVWAPCGLAGRSQRFREEYCFFSALKMETVHFSETLASTSPFTWRPNPEEHHQYCHHCENLKSHTEIFLVQLLTETLEN